MLQELAAASGTAAWAIASMLFFLVVWLAIVVWVVRKRPEEMEARARLPLDDEAVEQESPTGHREPQAGTQD